MDTKKDKGAAQQAPQGQAGDGSQGSRPQGPGPGVADMGDSASSQASQPAAAAPAPSSVDVARAMAPRFSKFRKITTASVAMRMRNRTEQVGFFGGQRVKPGKTFTLPAGEPIGNWMEPVDAKVADDQAKLLEASPKRRGSAGVVLKNPSRTRSGGGALDTPTETGANQDEGI